MHRKEKRLNGIEVFVCFCARRVVTGCNFRFQIARLFLEKLLESLVSCGLGGCGKYRPLPWFEPPDRPVRGESLYRLRIPGHWYMINRWHALKSTFLSFAIIYSSKENRVELLEQDGFLRIYVPGKTNCVIACAFPSFFIHRSLFLQFCNL